MSTQPSTHVKPALNGARIKQRKGVQKAQAKYEPEIFRDQFLSVVGTVPEDDLDAFSAKLDTTGNNLDYRKYGDPLFEILITGGILEPGGIIDDEGGRFSFSIFSCEETPTAIKKRVDVLNKLIRRYKYLSKAFEETLQNILQYINKWTPEEDSKLAIATAYFITTQLASYNVLKVLFKDYLVKDGHALRFSTLVFKTCLAQQGMDQVGRGLTSAGISEKLLDFFPPTKRDAEHLQQHYKAEDMGPFLEFYQKGQRNNIKGEFTSQLEEMLKGDASAQEVVVYVKQQMKESGFSEQDAAQMLWTAIMSSIDLINTRPDQVETQTLRQVNQWAKVLTAFTTSPKTEIILLQRVQTFCYDDAKLIKHFRQIVQLLYKQDVLSENAIIYWYEKGAKPSGKTVFLKQMEPFVKWLRENADSDEEESEEEE